MKLDLAIRAVIDDEAGLITELDRVGQRHRTDHDVFHMTHTLTVLHRANVEALGRFGEADDPGSAGPMARVREKASELAGRREEAGMLLLRDLRALHLLYAEASIDYILLAQGAQAARDAELLDAVSRAHAQTLRGMKWTVTRLKTAAPQVLAG
jgi:hypothetical protein